MWCDHLEHIVFVCHVIIKITAIISLNYLLAPWLYIPLRALASLITDTHSSLSTAFRHHLLTFVHHRSFTRFTSHLSLSLSLLLLPQQ